MEKNIKAMEIKTKKQMELPLILKGKKEIQKMN